MTRTPLSRACAAALLCTALAGCVPVLLGGAVVGGGLVVTDRRTTGTQIEDEGIELKAGSRVRELATLGHVSVVSYNRMVLVTGEVPAEAEKAAVGQAVAKVENVRGVFNELGIGSNSSIGSRSLDSVIATKVKASLIDAKDLQANAIKVVVERAIVYLMGRVTEREAARAAEVASAVGSVQKVVRVFEILTERELATLGTAAGVAPSASASAEAATASAPR